MATEKRISEKMVSGLAGFETLTRSDVDAYLVNHYARQSGDVTFGGILASIICYKQNNLVGYLNFYPAGAVPVSKVERSATFQTYITLNYAIERITEILDTLRLEKPLLIEFNSDYKSGSLGTHVEPVGEQEG